MNYLKWFKIAEVAPFFGSVLLQVTEKNHKVVIQATLWSFLFFSEFSTLQKIIHPIVFEHLYFPKTHHKLYQHGQRHLYQIQQ